MLDWVQDLIALRGLPPHGYCLLWDPRLIWTHVGADAIIAAAYFSIPIVLGLFVARRRDVEFGWVLVLFASFILACGTTHIFSILVLWVPAYGLEAVIKVLTAAISLATAIALWPLLPKLVALPSPRQLQLVNEQLRAEAAERERAQEMLRQSQKMEALGQLTAGIAHDFNNLLTAIIGNLDRAQRDPTDREKLGRSIDSALAASERAAKLTEQLLTFARKQPLMIGYHDVNSTIDEMSSLLEHTMGKLVSVRIDLKPGLPTVAVDRHLLENALLNLAINAHDAMPTGGNLIISTDEDANGDVVVQVRDDGAGMSRETASRAVDPFFTTKPIGEGTGLGLSQVYGFAAQAGGRLDIDSEPSRGTTMRIILPPSGQ